MTDVNQLITDHLIIWTAATEKKSSAGRGNGGGLILYGVQKLRELVLQLAVHGKLVPRVDSDGHAEVLLKEIEHERTRLLGQRHITKPRAVNANQMVAGTISVPSNWLQLPLTDVYLSISPSKNKLKKTEFEEAGEFPIVDQGQEFISGYCDRDDLVIAIPHPVVVFGDHTRNIKYVDFDFVAGADGTKIMCPLAMFPKYFAMFLTSLDIEAKGYSRHFKVLNSHVFNLPPLAEQHRIVAKVDELMALCDALERQAEDSLKAHQTLVETCLATLTNSQSPEDLTQNWARIEAHFDTLFTTEESVEALRRAVLDLALRGSLTDQREDAAPASVLLSELYAKNKKSASSRHRTTVSKIKEVEPSFDLPESWAWTNLGLLSSDLRYGTSKKCDRDDKLVPVLRIPNVSGGRVDLNDMKFGPLDPKEVADLRLRANDLLIIRSNGSLDIVGSFAVVPELEGDFAFAGYLVRVRIDPAFVDPRYVWYVSRSRFLRDQIEGPIRHGVGLKNVNSTELASLQFPIPPREEQERIVDKLDGLFELCDRLAQRVDDSNTINLALADTLASKIH